MSAKDKKERIRKMAEFVNTIHVMVNEDKEVMKVVEVFRSVYIELENRDDGTIYIQGYLVATDQDEDFDDLRYRALEKFDDIQEEHDLEWDFEDSLSDYEDVKVLAIDKDGQVVGRGRIQGS